MSYEGRRTRGHAVPDQAREVPRIRPAGTAGAYTPAVAETHSGLVFFVGDRAFKLKKAINLGFLDFTAQERRREACEREVALNRRLAPDVYLGVADTLGAVIIRSDVVRKELAGLPVDQPAPAPYGEGIYATDWSVATYRELLRRAHRALTHGETVVLDASWSDETRRADARRVAAETVSDLTELRCVAPADVTAARLAARAAVGGDASDADRDIADAMTAAEHPWPTSIAIDTVPEPRTVLGAALNHIATADNSPG